MAEPALICSIYAWISVNIRFHRYGVFAIISHLSGGQHITKSQTHNTQSWQACEQSQPVGSALLSKDKRTWFQYNKILSQEKHNQLHIFTEFWSTALRRTRLRYANSRYRRFWNCFELSATDKRNRQFRLWISKPVTSLWNQNCKG